MCNCSPFGLRLIRVWVSWCQLATPPTAACRSFPSFPCPGDLHQLFGDRKLRWQLRADELKSVITSCPGGSWGNPGQNVTEYIIFRGGQCLHRGRMGIRYACHLRRSRVFLLRAAIYWLGIGSIAAGRQAWRRVIVENRRGL